MKKLVSLLAIPTLSIAALSAEDQKPQFAGSFDTLIADSYTAPSGFKVPGGNVSQSALTLGIQNAIRKGDYLSATGWLNLSQGYHGSLGNKAVEGDLILGYNSGNIFNFLKGSVSANASVQYWDYPNRFLGDHDWVTDFALAWASPENWKVPLNISANWRHLFPRKEIVNGDYFHLSASTSLPLHKFGNKEKAWQLAFNPEMNAVLSHNFYLNGEDWNLRPFATLSLTNPKGNLSFRIGGGYNINLDKDPIVKANKPNQSLYTAGINIKF